MRVVILCGSTLGLKKAPPVARTPSSVMPRSFSVLPSTEKRAADSPASLSPPLVDDQSGTQEGRSSTHFHEGSPTRLSILSDSCCRNTAATWRYASCTGRL
ncbi:hypothetical protein VTK73DRAFT_4196 [Phialemonium thermophilum]|uniref:Uncharacterized protein n=1 Tax=Phialemonium thermophilum TaxID=223376 RepID=A0ABR3VB32_9PEZI